MSGKTIGDVGSLDLTGIHWVIYGGESGPGARPMHPDWIRSIREQALAAQVSQFFKQWGEWIHFMDDKYLSLAGTEMIYWDADHIRSDFEVQHGTMYKRVGENQSGAVLDSQKWEQFPARLSWEA